MSSLRDGRAPDRSTADPLTADPLTPDPALVRAMLETTGGRVLSVGRTRTRLHPDRTVSHLVEALLVEGPVGDGVAHARTLVIQSAPTADRDGATGTGGRWWLVPHDPALPGLAAALDRRHLQDWLGGVGEFGTPAWTVYRPGERAVLHVPVEPGPAAGVYLKVLPPDRLLGMHARLRAAAHAGVPVPAPLAPPEHGVLPLAAASGDPWRARFADPGAAHPSPRAVEELLDRLPGTLLAERPATSTVGAPGEWEDRLDAAVWATGLLDPAAVSRVVELADRARADLADGDAGPVVPVHGDLHPGHLLLDPAGAAVTGVLDADTLGAGHRADDVGTLLAHLAVAVADARARGGGGAVADRLSEVLGDFRAWAATQADERALRGRIHAVVLELAADPAVPADVRARRRAVLGPVRHDADRLG